MISVAKLVSGFSSSSKVGSLPNAPHEAKRKMKSIKNRAPPKKSQKRLIHIQVLVVPLLFLFFAIICKRVTEFCYPLSFVNDWEQPFQCLFLYLLHLLVEPLLLG